jgi:hypothetical protein
MKIVVTEKQYKLIVGQFNEQETTSSTDTSGGGAGYPQVGKWESGVTRGPGNQIGITKWSDVVGSLLKRGKANPLK